jgi:hypothetical protein
MSTEAGGNFAISATQSPVRIESRGGLGRAHASDMDGDPDRPVDKVNEYFESIA